MLRSDLVPNAILYNIDWHQVFGESNISNVTSTVVNKLDHQTLVTSTESQRPRHASRNNTH